MRNKNGAHSDDRGDMDNNTSLTERETEALLAGRLPSDPGLVPLHGVLASMKAALVVEPNPHHASAFATQLASAASSAEREGAAALVRVRVTSPWRRRLATAVSVAAVSALGVAGAAAADESAPGDLLYGVDRALERAGVLDGGTPERLGEAQQLLEEGEVDEALELAVDVLEGDGDGEAAAALHRAAIAVASQSSGADVRAQVATMLRWMAGEEARGAEFGATVSEFARQISGSAKADADAGDSGEDPADPGHSGNAPADPGNSGNAPADAGHNGNAPADPGDKDDKDKP